jgi:hypothetical protein
VRRLALRSLALVRRLALQSLALVQRLALRSLARALGMPSVLWRWE